MVLENHFSLCRGEAKPEKSYDHRKNTEEFFQYGDFPGIPSTFKELFY